MKPPRLAEWLLTHLVPGPFTDSLVGDLTEQVGGGRSALWYWRQVLIVLAGRVPWLLALSVAAAAWILPMMIWDWLMPWRAHRAPFWVSFAWPWSLAFEMYVTMATYSIFPIIGLAVTKRLRTARLFPLFAVMTVGEFLMTFATDAWSPGPHSYRLQYVLITLIALWAGCRPPSYAPR
jgi:hypothetical protein